MEISIKTAFPVQRPILGTLATIAVFMLSPMQSVFAADVSDFDLGEHNICVVDTNNNLECVSNEVADRHIPPDTITKYTAVDSGGQYSCAITDAGDITCWGNANFGVLNSPISSVPFVAISAAEAHACALDSSGQVSCWGLNTNGQTDVPADNSDFVAIYTGSTGSCGTKSTGESICWSNTTPYTDINGRSGIIDMQLANKNSETSCVVFNTGTHRCYGIYQGIDPLDDGPYTKVRSNSIMLCGLKTNGDMDCNLRDITRTRTPLNEALLADIEALPPLADFDTNFEYLYHMSFCGVDENRQLHCLGDSLPADRLPGEVADLPVPANLSLSVYGDNVAELLWNVDLSSISGAVGQFRIYRNGEMVNQGFGNASYLDRDFQIGLPYVYEVSYIAPDGMEGPRSEPLTVNAESSNPDVDSVINPVNPATGLTGLMLSRYGEGSLEIFWDRPAENIRQYDVYRNGALVASVPGPSYFDNQVNTTNAYQYTIAAISNSGEIKALGFTQVDSFSGFQCF